MLEKKKLFWSSQILPCPSGRNSFSNLWTKFYKYLRSKYSKYTHAYTHAHTHTSFFFFVTSSIALMLKWNKRISHYLMILMACAKHLQAQATFLLFCLQYLIRLFSIATCQIIRMYFNFLVFFVRGQIQNALKKYYHLWINCLAFAPFQSNIMCYQLNWRF